MRKTDGGGLRKLEDQVANWQSPKASDGKSPGISRDVHLNHQAGGKLNSDWVEALMGLPPGWTQLSDAEPGDNRIDRLRLLGNGVVPQTAEKAFRVLLERFNEQA